MPFRVLVVDDETAIREAIRMTLEYEGYRVDEARSGQDGIDKAVKTPYDAILLDIKMPVLDGIEVLENLKEQRVAAPVVMVSGHGDISTAVECTKRGAFFIAVAFIAARSSGRATGAAMSPAIGLIVAVAKTFSAVSPVTYIRSTRPQSDDECSWFEYPSDMKCVL